MAYRVGVSVLAAAGAVSVASAQPSGAGLADGLAIVEPVLGSWRVDGTWSWGATIEAESVYEPILGGAAVRSSTVVSDDGGEPYERYRALFVGRDADTIESVVFSHDGSVQTQELSVVRRDGGVALDSSWSMDSPGGPVRIDERLVLEGARVPWTVWMTPPGAAERQRVLGASWLPIEAGTMEAETPGGLRDEGLRRLEPLLGTWTIDATWADGSRLEATNEYRVGVGGMFIEVDTLVSDDGGEMYQRYHSVYDFDPVTDGVTAIGFDVTGARTDLAVEIDEDGLGFRTRSDEGPMVIEQSLRFEDEDTLRWVVRGGSKSGSAPHRTLMDGVWKRVRSE